MRILSIVAMSGLLFMFGASQSAVATNFFKWDVESNSVNACCGVTGDVVLKPGTNYSTATAHSGARSMQIQVTGQGGNETTGADIGDWNRYSWNIVGGPALYYRWWMKIMPGFSWGNDVEPKVKISRVLGGDVAVGYTAYMWPNGFNIAECVNDAVAPGQGCLDVDGTPGSDYNIKISYNMNSKADGQWHEYIAMVKPNTSASCTIKVNCDAQFKIWIDGVLIGQLLNWRLQAVANNKMNEGWGAWMNYPYWQMNSTVPAGGIIYLDDFSTDDTWNSLIPAGGVGGQLPSPKNLKAL